MTPGEAGKLIRRLKQLRNSASLSGDEGKRLLHDLEDWVDNLIAEGGIALTQVGEDPVRELAHCYTALGIKKKRTAILRRYAASVRSAVTPAMTILGQSWLLALQGLLHEFRQTAELAELAVQIADQSRFEVAALKRVEMPVQFPASCVERITTMAQLPASDALAAMADVFIQIPSLASGGVRGPVFGERILERTGRTTAQVDPGDEVGMTMRGISNEMSWRVPCLRHFWRTFLADPVNVTAVTDKCAAGMAFGNDVRPLCAAAIEAHAAGNWIVALHVALPLVERALRTIATCIGARTLNAEPSRHGGQNVRTLDVLLQDPAVVLALGADIARYLRALLSDARGWNVRNDVCHGLLDIAEYGAARSDRVLHAMMLLAQVQVSRPG